MVHKGVLNCTRRFGRFRSTDSIILFILRALSDSARIIVRFRHDFKALMLCCARCFIVLEVRKLMVPCLCHGFGFRCSDINCRKLIASFCTTDAGCVILNRFMVGGVNSQLKSSLGHSCSESPSSYVMVKRLSFGLNDSMWPVYVPSSNIDFIVHPIMSVVPLRAVGSFWDPRRVNRFRLCFSWIMSPRLLPVGISVWFDVADFTVFLLWFNACAKFFWLRRMRLAVDVRCSSLAVSDSDIRPDDRALVLAGMIKDGAGNSCGAVLYLFSSGKGVDRFMARSSIIR